MAILINPNVAYLFTVSAVMLFLLSAVAPKTAPFKVGMVFCLAAAGYEFSQLGGNLWAIWLVALSPLPFWGALRQPRWLPWGGIVTLLLLTLGSFYLVGEPTSATPQVDYGLPGLVAVLCGRILWVIGLRFRETGGQRLSDNPDSVVGLIGTASSALEKYETGSVELNGELWVARSAEPIPAGSPVRILRSDGAVLTVEKAEKLTKN